MPAKAVWERPYWRLKKVMVFVSDAGKILEKYKSNLEKKELNLKKENIVKKEFWKQMKS